MARDLLCVSSMVCVVCSPHRQDAAARLAPLYSIVRLEWAYFNFPQMPLQVNDFRCFHFHSFTSTLTHV